MFSSSDWWSKFSKNNVDTFHLHRTLVLHLTVSSLIAERASHVPRLGFGRSPRRTPTMPCWIATSSRSKTATPCPTRTSPCQTAAAPCPTTAVMDGKIWYLMLQICGCGSSSRAKEGPWSPRLSAEGHKSALNICKSTKMACAIEDPFSFALDAHQGCRVLLWTKIN